MTEHMESTRMTWTWPICARWTPFRHRNLQKCLSAKPALTEEHLKNAAGRPGKRLQLWKLERMEWSQAVFHSLEQALLYTDDSDDCFTLFLLMSEVTEACVLTDDEFLTKVGTMYLIVSPTRRNLYYNQSVV